MAANNLRFSRILRKYDFLIQELEDVSELQGEATREFMRDVAIAKGGGDDKDIEPIVVPDEEETPEKKEELPKEYKKLFRKIVIETHPDKQREGLSNAEKAKLVGIYESTIEAWDKGDQATLISNAVKLDLDVSDFEEDFNEIEEACVEIEKEINGIQSTSAWYYMYVLKTEKERELFIKNFLKLTDDLDENLLENEE
jgi:hypothetical protein